MKGSTVPPLTACIAPPLAAAMMSSWASTTLGAACGPASGSAEPTAAVASGASLPAAIEVNMRGLRRSRRGLGGKTRMDDRAVTGERGRLDDLVIPLDRQ